MSVIEQHYHVTFATTMRTPIFRDFYEARTVVRSLRNSDAPGFTQTAAFVVMPDHVHWLFQLRGDQLSRVVARVKSNATKGLQSDASVWQSGFHDRAVRSDESIESIAGYIVNNPVRGKLVNRIENYSHWYLWWI